jgi:hypothetical protein
VIVGDAEVLDVVFNAAAYLAALFLQNADDDPAGIFGGS